MHSLLLPTDFSAASMTAFEEAKRYAELVGRENTKFCLLAVLENLVPVTVHFEFGLAYVDAEGLQRDSLEKAKARLDEIAAERFSGFSVSTEVIAGQQPVHTEIIDYAKSHGANLIVMSTHGRTGVRHFVLGSVAERVIRETSCPVLVVPGADTTTAG